MGVFSCCGSTLKTLSRAAARSASAQMRRLGLRSSSADWVRRESICARCVMCITSNGISYCGRPFLRKPLRDQAIDGCGCPCRAKARDPDEHCPVDARHQPADLNPCNCKWCAP